MKSWRDILPIHPACELFPPMSMNELQTLGEDVKKQGLRVPVTIWKEQKDFPPKLLDGRSRLDAIEWAGFTISVENVGTDGDQAIRLWMRRSPNDMWLPVDLTEVRGDQPGGDPYAYVISANIHRRHLSNYKKRELIARLLAADPSKSDRQIGKIIKADNKTVASVRVEKEAREEIPHVPSRLDTKGRRQVAKGNRRTLPVRPQRTPAYRPNCTDKVSGPTTEVPEAEASDFNDLLLAWDRASETARLAFTARVGLRRVDAG